MDGNHDRHLSDLLGDHSMDDDRHDVLVGHRMNVMDDLNLDVNLLNRSYAPHDRRMDVNLDVKNLHVTSMDDLSMSCDRTSHDRLRYDHQMMHRHDKNPNLVARNLGVKNHHVNRRMMDYLMKVGPMTDDQKLI